MIKRSQVQVPAGATGELSLPGSAFCADLVQYFSMCSTPVLLAQYTNGNVKDPCHSAKSASSRLWLNAHVCTLYIYIYGFELNDRANRCMVVWCTQNLCQRWQQFHVAPAMQQPNNAATVPVHNFGGLKKEVIKVYNNLFRFTCDRSAVSLLESGE